MNKYLYFLVAYVFFFVSALEGSDESKQICESYKKFIQSVTIDTVCNDMVAYITLNDDSVWKGKCEFTDELTLSSWDIGDSVHLWIGDREGIRLYNRDKDTQFYVVPTKETLNSMLFITEIVSIGGGWFSNPTYQIHLSDGSVWRFYWSFGHEYMDWEAGQKVVVSYRFSGACGMVNLNKQWRPYYHNLRADLVEPYLQN